MGVMTDIAAGTPWSFDLYGNGAGSVEVVIPGDPGRYTIEFQSVAAAAIFWFLSLKPKADSFNGFFLPGQQARRFSLPEYGSAVQSQWYLQANSPNQFIQVLTIRLPGK